MNDTDHVYLNLEFCSSENRLCMLLFRIMISMIQIYKCGVAISVIISCDPTNMKKIDLQVIFLLDFTI